MYATIAAPNSKFEKYTPLQPLSTNHYRLPPKNVSSNTTYLFRSVSSYTNTQNCGCSIFIMMLLIGLFPEKTITCLKWTQVGLTNVTSYVVHKFKTYCYERKYKFEPLSREKHVRSGRRARSAHMYCVVYFKHTKPHGWPGHILNSYLIFVNSSDSLYMALSGSSLEEVVKPELRGEWESEKKNWFPSSENYAHDLREPGKSNFGSYLYFQVLITNRLLLLFALLFV